MCYNVFWTQCDLYVIVIFIGDLLSQWITIGLVIVMSKLWPSISNHENLQVIDDISIYSTLKKNIIIDDFFLTTMWLDFLVG